MTHLSSSSLSPPPSDQAAGEQVEAQHHPGGEPAHPPELLGEIADQPRLPLCRAVVRAQALGRRREAHPEDHAQLGLRVRHLRRGGGAAGPAAVRALGLGRALQPDGAAGRGAGQRQLLLPRGGVAAQPQPRLVQAGGGGVGAHRGHRQAARWGPRGGTAWEIATLCLYPRACTSLCGRRVFPPLVPLG